MPGDRPFTATLAASALALATACGDLDKSPPGITAGANGAATSGDGTSTASGAGGAPSGGPDGSSCSWMGGGWVCGSGSASVTTTTTSTSGAGGADAGADASTIATSGAGGSGQGGGAGTAGSSGAGGTTTGGMPDAGSRAPSITFTEFAIPTPSDPGAIAAGPDGNLWYTQE